MLLIRGAKEKPSRCVTTQRWLRCAVAISRMDVTLHNVVAHEPVDHIGALSVGSADHQRMPEDVAFIDERVGRDALPLPKVFERSTCSQAFAAYVKLLSVAGRMKRPGVLSVDIRKFHADVFEREAPINQQFPITFKLSGPAPNLGVRHGSVVAGARWGHSNTIQAAAWLVKLR